MFLCYIRINEGFTPAYLQAGGDHEFDVINGINRGQRGEDLVANENAP